MSSGVDLCELCKGQKILPVLTIDDASHARPLAEIMVRSGFPVIEITLRTPAALDAIQSAGQVKGCTAGAGTLLCPEDAKKAADAGAAFGVSPGSTDALLESCQTIGLPFLPGVATPGEAMHMLAAGIQHMKFFPAEMVGGLGTLNALAQTMPAIRFCPTGGIGAALAPDYLRLPNVVCVGGSWIASREEIAAGHWRKIEDQAKLAASLYDLQ